MHLSTRAGGPVLLAALLVLAGCGGSPPATPTPTPDDWSIGTPTESPTPSPTPTARPTPTPTATPGPLAPAAPDSADTQQGRQFLLLASVNGHRVVDARTDGDTFAIRYVANTTSRSTVRRQIGELAAYYGVAVNATWRNSSIAWSATHMRATAVSEEGEPLARFRVPAYWGRTFLVGNMSVSTFGRFVADTITRVNDSGAFPGPGPRARQFRTAVAAESNLTVESLETDGETAFLTVRTATADRRAYLARLQGVLEAYDAETERGWNTTALEITVRRPDGDLYGWYRATPAMASGVANGSEAASNRFLGTFVPENDHLEPVSGADPAAGPTGGSAGAFEDGSDHDP